MNFTDPVTDEELVTAFIDRNRALIDSQMEWKLYGRRPDTFPKNKVLEA
tara:strand:+ start:674 stop:820 length:147 start_codon:yes stop_codon:yes gene_type:complete